eukprot:Skav226453  [mRNA]  locus=scaffold3855:264357:274599:+ [translate_table: standard]
MVNILILGTDSLLGERTGGTRSTGGEPREKRNKDQCAKTSKMEHGKGKEKLSKGQKSDNKKTSHHDTAKTSKTGVWVQGWFVGSIYAPPMSNDKDAQIELCGLLHDTFVGPNVSPSDSWIPAGDLNEEPHDSVVADWPVSVGGAIVACGYPTRWDGNRQVDWFATSQHSQVGVPGMKSCMLAEVDEPNNKAPRRLNSNGATLSGEVLGVRLDFKAFRRLRCEDELSPAASKNVLRDIAKARGALRSEELHLQYMDEPVEEEVKYYVLSKRTGRLLELVPRGADLVAILTDPELRIVMATAECVPQNMFSSKPRCTHDQLPAVVIVLNALSFAFEEMAPSPVPWQQRWQVAVVIGLMVD